MSHHNEWQWSQFLSAAATPHLSVLSLFGRTLGLLLGPHITYQAQEDLLRTGDVPGKTHLHCMAMHLHLLAFIRIWGIEAHPPTHPFTHPAEKGEDGRASV